MNKSGIPIIFGEVLYDVFPDGTRVLGGAPFNVAWHCQAFGLKPLFISKIGNDAPGKDILLAMQEWGMVTRGMQIDTEHHTGSVQVSIKNGEPSYSIVENSAWDFIDIIQLPDLGKNSLLYHGSLSLRNNITEKSLSYLKQKTSVPVFVDVNLRPPWWSLDNINNIMSDAQWVKLNQEELNLIVPGDNDTISQAKYLLSKYNYEFIIVTQGAKGAVAISQTELCSIKPEHSVKVIDTVGAGDAFTSVLLLGLHKGWALHQIIYRAQEFASKIVALHGATVQDIKFYKPFINSWSL